MRKFGLIGFPLSHSFSKDYFSKKFAEEGLSDCEYEPYPLKSINDLKQLLEKHEDLEGLNVTIPYKKKVIRFLDEGSNAVKKIVACNCIKIRNGQLIGYNTDVTGFELSLLSLLQPHHTKALVLGTGGAAAAIKFVLNKLKVHFLFVSRYKKLGKEFITYPNVTKDLLKEYTLIINTTPLGMYPNIDQCPPIPYQYLTNHHYLFDCIYNPAETMFLKRGKDQGAVTKNGEEMLIIQAEESWKIWNGEKM
jgi:shikimate dehydrogenase